MWPEGTGLLRWSVMRMWGWGCMTAPFPFEYNRLKKTKICIDLFEMKW